MIEKHAANIEKYEVLKKEIERFPSVFIEGAACCGKTTMVRQYLRYLDASDADRRVPVQPDSGVFRSVQPSSYRTDDPSRQLFAEESQYGWSYRTLTWGVSDFESSLEDCLQWICGGSSVSGRILILTYRINSAQMQDAEEHVRKICDVIRRMPEQNKIIIESREKPFRTILDLVWHGEMGMISQQMLSLTEDEVRTLLEQRESSLNPGEVMELTGGWAGCVQMLITMEKMRGRRSGPEDLMQMYEIRYFIREQILSTLTQEEQDLVSLIRQCGWATDEMIRFFLQPSFTGRETSIQDYDELTADLIRKGILFQYTYSDQYHVRKMFCPYGENGNERSRDVQYPENMLAFWYEEHGYLQEAADLFIKMPVSEFHAFLIREYTQIPFLKINLSGITYPLTERSGSEHPQIESELVYLCGIAALRSRDLQQVRSCAEELDRRGGFRDAEMLVNLTFADVRCETADWYRLLERKSEPGKRFHLFHAKKQLYSCLYGVRELSDHFACLKKDQNRYERLWKEYFGSEESVLFAFARAEYLAETFQEDKISEEDREQLLQQTELHPEQFLPVLFRIRALCRDRSGISLSDERIRALLLRCTPDASSYQLIQLLQVVYTGQEESGFNRVRFISENYNTILRLNPETFYYRMFLLAEGLVLLRQYSKAERILRLLDPVLNRLAFSRLQAEALFLSALVHQSQGRTGLAAQEVVESFAVAEPYRYAAFYTRYGEAGRELMKGYLDWMKKNASYRVHKKRYQYGSLLNVPHDEFVEVLIRKCRKMEIAKQDHSGSAGKDEHLTMMELIILQDLQEGLSNQQICEKENLKLPTVKSHLYNVYRKLGVRNRGQAVRTAVEQEILKNMC